MTDAIAVPHQCIAFSIASYEGRIQSGTVARTCPKGARCVRHRPDSVDRLDPRVPMRAAKKLGRRLNFFIAHQSAIPSISIRPAH